jgi:TPR repeat protein
MDYWKPLLKKADCDAQYRVGLVYFMGIDKPHDFKDAHKFSKRKKYKCKGNNLLF